MSEFSFSNACKKKKNESASVLSHSFIICFFIIFSPYLLRLLSFFSPLLITTSLLLLFSLLTLSHPNLVQDKDDSEFSESKLGFLLSVLQTLVDRLSSKNDESDEGIGYFEEFQAYLDMFRAPVFEVLEENFSESGYSGDEGRESRDHVGPMEKESNVNLDENPIGEDDDDKVEEAARPIAEEKSLENNTKLEAMFCQKEHQEVLEENYSESGCSGDEGRDHVGLKEDPNVNLEENPIGEDDVDKVPIAEEKGLENNTKLEDVFCQKGDKEVKPLDPEPNKAEESKEKLAVRSGSKVVSNNDSRIDTKDSAANSDEEYFGTPERNWEYIGSYGSMRKEKEWRRTLAFKLYEERHNVGGSEGMDLLWETYDDTEPNSKVQGKGNTNSEDNDDEEEEEEAEKEKGMEGKYCCLQALKFSAGKMNLGMRRPSLVKISKALKSFGLLHHVSKNGRKRVPLN